MIAESRSLAVIMCSKPSRVQKGISGRGKLGPAIAGANGSVRA